MCELLNRIWSRPRGEWTRVLRKELPTLAAKMVEELLETVPGFAALVEDVDDEVVRQQMEAALLTALGYREGAGEDRPDACADPEPVPGAGVETRSGARIRPKSEAEAEAETEHARPHTHADTHVHAHTRPHSHDRNPGAFGGGELPPLQAVPLQRFGSVRERARRELFAVLTGETPLRGPALAELANAAGWPLPVAVRAVVLASPGETQQLAALLDDCLGGMVAGQPCLLVPAPDPEARTALDCALRGRLAVVGHPVAPGDTASSLRWALRLLSLTPAPTATRSGSEVRALFVDDHLSTLLLLQDEPLAHALAARWLRPLADLTPRQSERLEVTLLAWLEGGGAPEAAKALSVHPQTVRYRMRQLEKLFGPGLRDPRTRFELELALRSRRLMAQVRLRPVRGIRRARGGADLRPALGDGRVARVNGL
ncbi:MULTISPECIES: helix-turn-helix domain-containing protein [unclassified Streptomyces]|uniref:PucR family transcriptional regulator n=1 Tax=unclassified Streptomyces TaxID=2593676 RepID=UPI000DC7912C|nr:MULTISPECIES: helix-turn-helix domain-containing protein [unclassified Streptomyces]AWZ09190.1 PucR family transcriptional regulator [Streptomyces sp. ICC4]AWZ16833.1 PucR family transcriptional regulator [Streptomyces sp. ICC1]